MRFILYGYLIIEANSTLRLNDIEKIVQEVKNSTGICNIIFGEIINDSLEDGIIKALIINTYGKTK